DRVPAQHPIFFPEDSALFPSSGICIRDNDQLRCDFRGHALQPDVETPDRSRLKIVKTESVRGVKNDRDSSKIRSPAPENTGLRTVRMYDLRPLPPEQTPEFQECNRVL